MWREVNVGDIVRVDNSDYFPADLILICSSESEGQCYIETSQLDGETNLKIRQGLTETAGLGSEKKIENFNGNKLILASINSEAPNNSLYTFDATMELNAQVIPLSPDQLLLRGAQLRNTDWIYGIVVFTGHETKLMKNASSPRVKKTKVELMVNSQIIFLLIVLVTISLICAAGSVIYQEPSTAFYRSILFGNDGNNSVGFNFFMNFLTFIVLYNNLIPLSLVITIEVVKLVLAYLIESDLDLYYPDNDTRATARTSSLVEELGQVDFIFSDKTGTLTCNIMEFKMASIAGMAYAETVPDGARYESWSGFEQLMKDERNGINASAIREFLTLISVCHTVIPEKSKKDPDGVQYQSASPDETALVDGARRLGYFFKSRKPKSITIRVDGQIIEFAILAVNEFNSTRKRMSILARGPNGRIILMVKGADTVIFERLRRDDPNAAATNKHLETYATIGLRTLCLASREISEKEYDTWKRQYDEASTTLDGRAQKLEEVAESIERDLTLLGATGIEDKLQEGVPDTISILMEAGIKIWVLTGDRQETAINIGYSCKLITPDMQVVICNETTLEATKISLETALSQAVKFLDKDRPFVTMNFFNRLMRNVKKSDIGKFNKNYGANAKPMVLVIDGKTLSHALDPSISTTFLHLAMLCKAVICCRVSPLQKALVVKLVKKNVAQTVTLAIGDGANDVTMIQAAHVGIGISGLEGLQAARSADFAIAQFRFLRKLLLVHGGWAYSRITKVIVFSFYKNITLYLIQLWFAVHNQFSGQTLFETWSSVSSYNVLWTVLAPLAIGMFDQYICAAFLDKYPEIYHQGQKDVFYNNKVFFQWLGNSALHSLAIFFLWKAILGESDVLPNGWVADNWAFGEWVYATTLLTVLVKTCLIVDLWVVISLVCVFGSFILFFILFPLYTVVGADRIYGLQPISPELFNLNTIMWNNYPFWFAFVLIPILINFRDYAWKAPKTYHIVQEIQKYRIPDYRPQRSWFTKASTIVQLHHPTSSGALASGGRTWAQHSLNRQNRRAVNT